MPTSHRRPNPALLMLSLIFTAACSEEADPRVSAAGPSLVETQAEPTAVYAIQGRSHVSTLAGARVVTTGVVTAVGFNGFYLQDPAGDGDPLTSDAIFVFTSSRPTVAAGQALRVTGLVSEFVPGGVASGNLSTTQLARAAATEPLLIQTLSSGNPLPAPVLIGRGGRIPPARHVISPAEIATPIDLRSPTAAAATPFNPEADGIDFFESLEAMRVTVQDPVAVSPIQRFSAVSSELFTLADGGRDAEPKRDRTERGGIALGADPANEGDQQPERVQIQFDGTLYPGTVPAVAVGDRLGNVTGVVGYSFGNFEVNATATVSVAPGGLQPETGLLTATGRALTVVSYNVLNLGGGGEDAAQRARLGAQIAGALRSPDIIALQEVQDNNGEQGGASNLETDASQTLAALAASIAAAGGPTYAFADVAPAANSSGGVPGGNIRPSFLYRADRVTLVSVVAVTPEVLATAGAADTRAFEDSRTPLAGTFEFGGRRLTVVNNHFSSRSGSSPVFGALQPFVQAAEAQREAQARAVHDYVASLIRADRSARVMVVGDLNTFEFTDDLVDLLPGSDRILKDLLGAMEDDNRYSFIFDGNSQLLDHMFATRNLLDGAGFDIVHLNVDFPLPSGQVAASDHEPMVARVTLR